MINATPATADERSRYRFDLEAHQIDAVLDHHQVAGSVTSGTVRRRTVEFDVQAPLSTGLERMRGLKDHVMTALGVRDVAFSKQDGHWRLQVERRYEPPVPLASLLAGLPEIQPCTAAIGLSDTGQPVLLNFGPDAVSHVLVAGETGAGKTTLLRSLAAGLALSNRQGDVQLLLINGTSDNGHVREVPATWRPLAYLPHLMTDLVAGPDVGAELLRFLVGEMAYRRNQRVRWPRIVVLIDNAVALLEAAGPEVTDDVLRLLQHGCNSGIHLVLATSQPQSALLDALFLSNLPIRIVGKLSDAALGKKITGSDDLQAQYLRGAGEFIAIANGQQTYFQAADIGDYDLHWELNRLLGSTRPRLLARPFDTRPALVAPDPMPTTPRTFERKNGVHWVDPVASPMETADSDEELAGGLS